MAAQGGAQSAGCVTIHFVYVHGDTVDTTNAIGREIAKRLRNQYDIVVHHPSDATTIIPQPGDVLIGHPNRYWDCVFSRSFRQPGWERRIVFAPYSHGLIEDAAAIDHLVDAADIYLAITGDYWIDRMPDSPCSHWAYKTVRCDLGVEREHYPKLKQRFNPPGQRRFYYLGNSDPMRGGDYLADLADANPDLSIGWIAASQSRDCLTLKVEPDTRRLEKRMRNSRLKRLAPFKWHSREARPIMATFDFVLNCGRSDATPCEQTEGAARGHVCITTPQCGFAADDWMVHIPLDNQAEASRILHYLNTCPEEELLARQRAGEARLQHRNNWDAVTRQVIAALEMPIPAAPTDPVWKAKRAKNRRELARQLRRIRLRNAVGRFVDDCWLHGPYALYRARSFVLRRLSPILPQTPAAQRNSG
jgi:hypothetical protein